MITNAHTGASKDATANLNLNDEVRMTNGRGKAPRSGVCHRRQKASASAKAMADKLADKPVDETARQAKRPTSNIQRNSKVQESNQVASRVLSAILIPHFHPLQPVLTDFNRF